MKKDLASQIMKAAASLDRELGELDSLIGRIEDEDEKKEYAKALGDIIGFIARDFIFRIEREYPDLNPDK